MKQLLIDIGNSRVKWSVAGPRGMGRQQAAPRVGDGLALFRRLLRTAPGISSVVAVCVAGLRCEHALRRAAREAGLPPPRLVRSEMWTAGVRNGYAEPWRLGADRWVAAIGAWHLAGARRAVCVVDVGTALTLDVVDATGRHRGGLIVPGPALMVESLLAGTTGIAVRAGGPVRRRPRLLATATRGAIDAGATLATAAFVDRAIADLRREHGRTLALYLTGGAVPQVRPDLRSRAIVVPDLVLRGLQVVAASPAADGA